jgi:segregation and condensation protein A
MTYNVRTAVFEGPLDLLCQLISRKQVDVAAVSLTDLVVEYVACLEEMARLDLELTSEFVLIAATLIQLKAHRLLPTDQALDLDEDLELMEERDRLLVRLLTCVTFKDVSAVLLHRLQEHARLVPRTFGLDQTVRAVPPDPELSIDGSGLARMAAAVLARLTQEPDLDHLDLDLPSVQEAIDELRGRLGEQMETTFDTLVVHCQRPIDVAAYFLALLELARWGMISVTQKDWTSQIKVKRTDRTDEAFVSEWSS